MHIFLLFSTLTISIQVYVTFDLQIQNDKQLFYKLPTLGGISLTWSYKCNILFFIFWWSGQHITWIIRVIVLILCVVQIRCRVMKHYWYCPLLCMKYSTTIILGMDFLEQPLLLVSSLFLHFLLCSTFSHWNLTKSESSYSFRFWFNARINHVLRSC